MHKVNVGIIKDALPKDVFRIYQEASSMIKEKRYSSAFAIFYQLSLYPLGQNGLGICYAHGFFVEKDMENGRRL